MSYRQMGTNSCLDTFESANYTSWKTDGDNLNLSDGWEMEVRVAIGEVGLNLTSFSPHKRAVGM